jgi:hypothetical protein
MVTREWAEKHDPAITPNLGEKEIKRLLDKVPDA